MPGRSILQELSPGRVRARTRGIKLTAALNYKPQGRHIKFNDDLMTTGSWSIANTRMWRHMLLEQLYRLLCTQGLPVLQCNTCRELGRSASQRISLGKWNAHTSGQHEIALPSETERRATELFCLQVTKMSISSAVIGRSTPRLLPRAGQKRTRPKSPWRAFVACSRHENFRSATSMSRFEKQKWSKNLFHRPNHRGWRRKHTQMPQPDIRNLIVGVMAGALHHIRLFQ